MVKRCGTKCKILLVLVVIGILGAIIYYTSMPKGIKIYKAELPPGTKLVYSGVANNGFSNELNYTETLEVENPTKMKRVIYPVGTNNTFNTTKIEFFDKEGRMIKYETPPVRIPTITSVNSTTLVNALIKSVVEYEPPLTEFEFPLYSKKTYDYSGIVRAKRVFLEEDKELIFEEYVAKGQFNCTDVFEKKVQDRNATCIQVNFHVEYATRKRLEKYPHPRSGEVWNGTVIEKDFTGRENATRVGTVVHGYYIYCDGIGVVEYRTHNEIHKEEEPNGYYINDMKAKLVSIEWGGFK